MLLRPGEPAALPEDLQRQPVLAPQRHRGGPEPAHGAPVHAERDQRVVLQRAALDGRDDVGRQPRHLLPRHEGRHVERVDPAIGELRRHPRLRRVVAPAHARVLHVGRVRVMAVGELGVHHPHPAEVAARHHRPHVPHERVARVAVVDGADGPGLAGERHDLLGLPDGHRHGLLAQHVEARGEEGPRDLVMRGVRGRDRHEVQAAPLSFQHLAPRAVGTLAQPEAPAVGPALLRAVVERRGPELEQPVEPGAEAVGRPDLAPLAAADEAPGERAHAANPIEAR